MGLLFCIVVRTQATFVYFVIPLEGVVADKTFAVGTITGGLCDMVGVRVRVGESMSERVMNAEVGLSVE
jgi:hypothetical protein